MLEAPTYRQRDWKLEKLIDQTRRAHILLGEMFPDHELIGLFNRKAGNLIYSEERRKEMEDLGLSPTHDPYSDLVIYKGLVELELGRGTIKNRNGNLQLPPA